MSSSHHPQTEGTSEVMNRKVDYYQRVIAPITNMTGMIFFCQLSLSITPPLEIIYEFPGLKLIWDKFIELHWILFF